MAAVTGSLAIRYLGTFYSIRFPHHGWMAADMVQYVGEIYESSEPRIKILKLLGYTLQMNSCPPPRNADHWVEIDLEARLLSTNSELIRKAVHRLEPDGDEPYLCLSLRNVYRTLDRHDFSVKLFS